jgi:hypothetical protein
MKQIIIKSCGECPYYHWILNKFDEHWYSCKKLSEYVHIFDDSIIDRRCPLDNYKVKDEKMPKNMTIGELIDKSNAVYPIHNSELPPTPYHK